MSAVNPRQDHYFDSFSKSNDPISRQTGVNPEPQGSRQQHNTRLEADNREDVFKNLPSAHELQQMPKKGSTVL